jgi:hypothetical protein
VNVLAIQTIIREPFSEETRKNMRDWYENQYTNGREEGTLGREYSGNTHIGYYGWLDGRTIFKKRLAEGE